MAGEPTAFGCRGSSRRSPGRRGGTAAARGRGGDRRQDQHLRARAVAVHRGPGLRRDPQSVEPGAHAPAVRRAVRPPPSPPVWCRPRSARTAPDRSASRPPGPIWSGSSRSAAGSRPGRAAEAFNGITVNGPLARTVADAALLLDAAAGNHDGDPHRPPAVSASGAAGRDPGRLRIALSLSCRSPRCPPGSTRRSGAVVELAEKLGELGHHVEEADPRYGQIGLTFVPRSTAGLAELAPRPPVPRCSTRAPATPPGSAAARRVPLRAARAPRRSCIGVSARSSRRTTWSSPDDGRSPATGRRAAEASAAGHRPRDDRGLSLRLAVERPGLARGQRPRRVLGRRSAGRRPVAGPANSEPLLISLAAQLEAGCAGTSRGRRSTRSRIPRRVRESVRAYTGTLMTAFAPYPVTMDDRGSSAHGAGHRDDRARAGRRGDRPGARRRRALPGLPRLRQRPHRERHGGDRHESLAAQAVYVQPAYDS